MYINFWDYSPCRIVKCTERSLSLFGAMVIGINWEYFHSVIASLWNSLVWLRFVLNIGIIPMTNESRHKHDNPFLCVASLSLLLDHGLHRVRNVWKNLTHHLSRWSENSMEHVSCNYRWQISWMRSTSVIRLRNSVMQYSRRRRWCMQFLQGVTIFKTYSARKIHEYFLANLVLNKKISWILWVGRVWVAAARVAVIGICKVLVIDPRWLRVEMQWDDSPEKLRYL